MNTLLKDAIGKTPDERFAEIRAYFFEHMKMAGGSRTELYSRPKPGESREPTEEEVVMRFARTVSVTVNDIQIGIARAFAAAADRRNVVTSFRYCVPHIVARCNELRESRAGLGPEATQSVQCPECNLFVGSLYRHKCEPSMIAIAQKMRDQEKNHRRQQ